jgi:hypothetical protein
MFARHMAGQELNHNLRDHLLNLLGDYRRLGKTNDAISAEGLNRLFEQVWYGRITPEMQLACNEIMDYAHSALMREYMTAYKQTGVLPHQEDVAEDILASYSGDSGGANGGAVESGVSFADCEDGNGVSDVSAAAALAEETGLSLEEALRVIKKRKGDLPYNASLTEKYGAENVYLGQCGACGSHGEVGPCGPGFCNDCDSRDRIERGYILALYNKRMAQKEKIAPSLAEPEIMPESIAVAKRGETVFRQQGQLVRYEQRLTVGGVKEVLIDVQTGAELEA